MKPSIRRRRAALRYRRRGYRPADRLFNRRADVLLTIDYGGPYPDPFEDRPLRVGIALLRNMNYVVNKDGYRYMIPRLGE